MYYTYSSLNDTNLLQKFSILQKGSEDLNRSSYISKYTQMDKTELQTDLNASNTKSHELEGYFLAWPSPLRFLPSARTFAVSWSCTTTGYSLSQPICLWLPLWRIPSSPTKSGTWPDQGVVSHSQALFQGQCLAWFDFSLVSYFGFCLIGASSASS